MDQVLGFFCSTPSNSTNPYGVCSSADEGMIYFIFILWSLYQLLHVTEQVYQLEYFSFFPRRNPNYERAPLLDNSNSNNYGSNLNNNNNADNNKTNSSRDVNNVGEDIINLQNDNNNNKKKSVKETYICDNEDESLNEHNFHARPLMYLQLKVRKERTSHFTHNILNELYLFLFEYGFYQYNIGTTLNVINQLEEVQNFWRAHKLDPNIPFRCDSMYFAKSQYHRFKYDHENGRLLNYPPKQKQQ